MNDIKIKEIITKSYISPSKLPGFDYVINPYVGCPHACLYCYAEFMKRFTHHQEPWGSFTDVKIRSTSAQPIDLYNKKVFLSSVTDCYNPLEEKYRLTRRLLEKLKYSGAKVSLLTKSALVLRDMDLFTQMPDIEIGFSLNTTDDAFRQKTEPYASSVQERLNALNALHRQHIKTWLHISPLFPQISPWKEILQKTSGYVASFSFENLKLRADGLTRVMHYITQHYPQLKPLYQQIYEQKDMGYWYSLREEITDYCRLHTLSAAVYFSDKA